MREKFKFYILAWTVSLIILLLFPNNVKPGQVTQSAKFVPTNGKILLIIGQDKDTFDKYVAEIGITPAGFMAYTSIQNLEGLYGPIDFGSGIQHIQYYVDKYANLAAQIGLYMVGALDDIIEGYYDENINILGEWIKKAKRPVYLRIGYEFDFPENHYEPEKYIKAYRYIVDSFRKSGIKNVAYVWHSYASHLTRPVMDWYPGDEYVDWFAISYFMGRNKYADAMAKLTMEHNKPFMIAESTPYGIGTQKTWDRWFQPFIDFINEKNVKAVCYINANWDEQSLWKGQGWGDARIQASEIIKKRWIDEIKKERYIQSSPELYEILGYTTDK